MNKILIVLICVLIGNNLFSQTLLKGRINNWPNKHIMIKIPSEKASISVLSNEKGEYSTKFNFDSPFEGWLVLDKDSTNFFGNGFDTLTINGNYNKKNKEFIFNHNNQKDFKKSEVKIIDGSKVDSFPSIPSLLENKVTLIEIWATWCGPCIEQQKIIENYKPIYKDKGVEFFYISMDTEQNSLKWKRYIDFKGLKGMHLLANEKLWNDIVVTRKDASIPVYYIVDKNKNMHLFKATKINDVKDMIKIFKLNIAELFSTIDGYVK